MRELLLIAAGTLLGSCLGVTMMCLFQINKDCRVKRKEDTDYEMRELSSIGNNINQLAAKANTLGFIDAPMLKNEAAKWNKFQSEIERTYLRPNQSEMKWQ